jgi:uncharacterized protein involved in exopolysaccharide biosynthesis
MNEEDLKAILATYQQKTFEIFNSNIVLETQVKTLQSKIEVLNNELEKLKKKRPSKTEEDFI